MLGCCEEPTHFTLVDPVLLESYEKSVESYKKSTPSEASPGTIFRFKDSSITGSRSNRYMQADNMQRSSLARGSAHDLPSAELPKRNRKACSVGRSLKMVSKLLGKNPHEKREKLERLQSDCWLHYLQKCRC